MKNYILPLLAASAAATPALAAPTITFTTTSGLPSYTTAQIFESFDGINTGGGSNSTAFTTRSSTVPGTGVTASEAATFSRVYTNTVPGVAVDTDSSSNNNYLAVQAGGAYTVTFSAPVQFFSFIIGSIDSYNNLKLTLSDGTVVTPALTNGGSATTGASTSTGLSGTQIIGQTGVGPLNSSVAGRVSFDFGGGAGLVSAVFSSSRDAFEIDDLAAAVPEAATWAMMMVGLGVVGGAVRRRKTKVSVRFAAA